MWLVVERIVVLLVMEGIIEHSPFKGVKGFASHMTERIAMVGFLRVGIRIAVQGNKLV